MIHSQVQPLFPKESWYCVNLTTCPKRLPNCACLDRTVFKSIKQPMNLHLRLSLHIVSTTMLMANLTNLQPNSYPKVAEQ